MNNGITEYFENVKLTKEYDGYFCKISDVITISILGCICGLKNTKQIHQWASNSRISKFLKDKFEHSRKLPSLSPSIFSNINFL